MRFLNSVVLFVFLGVVAIFCLQNLTTVPVAFLGWIIKAPMPLLIFIVYLLGMVSGWNVLSFIRRTYRNATEHRDRTTA